MEIVFLAIIAGFVRGSCNHERLLFTTLGGVDPDPAAYTYVSKMESFQSGSTMCFYYRFIDTFVTLDASSKYHILDVDGKVIMFTAFDQSASMFLTVMFLNLETGIQMVPIPVIPQLWSSICFIHEREKKLLHTMHRFGKGLQDVWNELALSEGEEIISSKRFTFGNSSLFNKGADKSFPSAISNIFLANYPLADRNSATLSYIHRESKPWMMVNFLSDTLKFPDLSVAYEFREDDSLGMMRTIGREPIFRRGYINLKGAQSVNTIGDLQAFWMMEYNIMTKDPSLAWSVSIVMEINQLPVSNYSEIVHLIQHDKGCKLYITAIGNVLFQAGTNQEILVLSNNTLPLNKRFELLFTLGYQFMLYRYDASLFIDGLRVGMVRIQYSNFTNFGNEYGGYQAYGQFGSTDPKSELDWNLLKFYFWDGMIIPEIKECQAENRYCSSNTYITSTNTYGCMNCQSGTQTAILAGDVPEIKCTLDDPNKMFENRKLMNPFEQKNIWVDCEITQFGSIGCPICHPSCLTCKNVTEAGCLSCPIHKRIKLEGGYCLVHNTPEEYTVFKDDKNSIIIQSSDPDG